MAAFSNVPDFVLGPTNAEDLAWVPGSRWLIASGMDSSGVPDGHLYLVDMDVMESTEIFPGEVGFELDAATFGDVAQPSIAGFCAHGLALREGADGVHTLYVVNHGGREAIEVFAVDARGEQPRLTWVGAVIQAPGVWGNAVVALPDGGIAATNYLDLRDPHAFDKVYAGEVTGNLKEWHGREWEDVPGSELSSPNGLEVSPDGRWYFVNCWSSMRFVRLSRGSAEIDRREVELGFLLDNVKWAPDGRLLVAGQASTPAAVFERFNSEDVCNIPSRVVALDPETLEAEVLVEISHDVFGTGSTALIVGDDLWVGSARSDRIARFAGH